MALLKLNQLKKELKQLEQNELIQLISEMYKINKDVQQYLSNKFIGEEAIKDLYERTKKIVRDEFFPERGFAKMRLGVARDAISTFKKLSSDEGKTIDLMLYFVETGTKFTNTYGDIEEKFYNSMVSMYNKVVNECNKSEGFYNIFKDRLYSIVGDTDGIGWGYHDDICAIYYSLDWLEEDEEDE
ncbi:DUF6155 family protein [Niallia sp. Sow4_A1]|uniref:DUF6155 family protein n=1 Tax=Niallia hominis TaxID=3133173 RepID=A0ABV1F0E3_9BACI|nr:MULTISPECIES: DUF6155 family protein [Bacillaceae]MCF2649046.1 hypothetical protein [Niallia circulans]MCM3363152.1 DUF6155 family protein [Niallia sp. MER TA 168]CAI9390012.1 hypothetical protein BACSP_02685 [Bacillus sp. T2.9-1]